jgi:hypothetical protein
MSDPIPPNSRFRSRTISIMAGCVAATAFVGVFCLAYRLLEAQTAPSGLVEEPQLLGVDTGNPAGQLFNYRGYTNFPGSQGRVEIYVLTQGNGDSTNQSLWKLVRTVTPSNTGTVVGSETRYAWSTGSVALFGNSPGENRWPQGGTARVRFKAVRGTVSSDLPVRDNEDKRGLDLVLVLSDYNPNPAQPPGGQLTPNYLATKSIKFPTSTGWTQENETTWYYQNAFVDQAGTLSVWDGIPDLAEFRSRYFGPIKPDPNRPDCASLSTPETVATYFNKGDLGLGREMHCIDNHCTQEIACYVKNYGALNASTTPSRPALKFDDRAAALQALNAGKHFATVAMVERQWMGGLIDRPLNKVIFLVFDEHDILSTGPVRLDNKGFNTFNPGNCLVCHGTSSSYHWDTATVRDAYFLPFDLQAFEYFSSDPTHPLARARQEDAFKALNRIVYFSDLWALDAPNTLIDKWYDFFTRSTFLNNAVPDSWNTNDNSRQLYKQVVAKACRTCHISEKTRPALAFGTFTDFDLYKLNSAIRMCGPEKSMPQAEQTIKVLWKSAARSHFLNRSSIQNMGCGYEVAHPADYKFEP